MEARLHTSHAVQASMFAPVAHLWLTLPPGVLGRRSSVRPTPRHEQRITASSKWQASPLDVTVSLCTWNFTKMQTRVNPLSNSLCAARWTQRPNRRRGAWRLGNIRQGWSNHSVSPRRLTPQPKGVCRKRCSTLRCPISRAPGCIGGGPSTSFLF